MNAFPVVPIGTVHSTRLRPEDDDWDRERTTIHLDPDRVGPEATLGLEDFSHVEVIYLFHRVEPDEIVVDARHPRGNRAWPRVGILAQRGKGRPNRIGATVCRLLEVGETSLVLEGLDAIDGTPVLDVKPVMRAFLPRGPHREPAWATELMAGYWSSDA